MNPTSVREDWSRNEVDVIVADYLDMLSSELAGRHYNKAEHNSALRRVLSRRSRGSIEFKHQNISAVLVELGLPYIEGYKPRRNYQDLLRDIVVQRVTGDIALQSLANQVVTADAVAPALLEWSQVVEEAPLRERASEIGYERLVHARSAGVRVNFLEREARNQSLGKAGEEFVLALEHRRLWASGHRRLADKVEHVSRSRGDGLGYDILSFEPTGQERLIEVKTTRFGKMSPFFASRNEVEVSVAEQARYHLYRLFRFERGPRLFVLQGSLQDSVILDPVAYRATLR